MEPETFKYDLIETYQESQIVNNGFLYHNIIETGKHEEKKCKKKMMSWESFSVLEKLEP